jgi:drug/metabolite transporter (DMT)-like permease
MSWLWVIFTVTAAAGQTARNAMQRELTPRLGAAGATHVRFLFGFPFALLFLAAVCLITGDAFPMPTREFWFWLLLGALTQIAGTALMLLTMTLRSFVVTTAYLKTEPLQVAAFGLVLLGDALKLPTAAAILIATAGVMLISYTPGGFRGGMKPALMGLAAAACFALSAIGYRGAIRSLSAHDFVMAATFSLAIGLVVQTALLSAYLAVRDRSVLTAIVRLWRPSMFAGFMGAAASEFWFLAFALATAASVRTLGLVDVLFAQAATHFVFKQKTTRREIIGIALVITGCVLLVWTH